MFRTLRRLTTCGNHTKQTGQIPVHKVIFPKLIMTCLQVRSSHGKHWELQRLAWVLQSEACPDKLVCNKGGDAFEPISNPKLTKLVPENIRINFLRLAQKGANMEEPTSRKAGFGQARKHPQCLTRRCLCWPSFPGLHADRALQHSSH